MVQNWPNKSLHNLCIAPKQLEWLWIADGYFTGKFHFLLNYLLVDVLLVMRTMEHVGEES